MLTLAAFFHSFDGVLLPISGEIAIRFYGLTYVIGFISAWFVLTRLAKRNLIDIPPHRVADAMLIIILGTLLGGRLGYVIFYETTPWLDRLANIYKVWQGGMASHGGMVGIVIACYIVSRGFRDDQGHRIGQTSTFHIMDCMAIVSCFGLFLGRIANFVNGELLGDIVSPPGKPGPWWSVQFPQELSGWIGPAIRDPKSHTPALSPEQLTQLEALVASVRKPDESWQQALSYITHHAAKFQSQLEPLLSSRHPSQLYQAIAEGLILGLVTWAIWALPRKPGVVAAWWFMLYGVMRIVTEFWRLPDPQFLGEAARPLGLSRGQWLSALMVLGGGILLAVALLRKSKPLGGWLRPAPATTP